MKIRNGFVSNSSSSSFTCDVCGENSSGMDMGISEAGMFECESGHTCCESHQITQEMSTEEKRKRLIAEVENESYYKTRPREKAVELDEIENLNEDEVNDKFDELMSEGNHPACECPICMFQKVDVDSVLSYLLAKCNMTIPRLLEEIKTKYPSFAEFQKQFPKKTD